MPEQPAGQQESYLSDTQHENLLTNQEIASIAQQALMTTGASYSWNNTVYENPSNPFYVNVDVNGGDASNVRNVDAAGYSATAYYDNSNNFRGSIGCSNSGAGFATSSCFLSFNQNGLINPIIFAYNSTTFMSVPSPHYS